MEWAGLEGLGRGGGGGVGRFGGAIAAVFVDFGHFGGDSGVATPLE